MVADRSEMNQLWRHLRTEEQSPDRITVWLDVSNRSVNVLFDEVFDEVLELLCYAKQRSKPPTIVFRTAKLKGFIVGADLRRILACESDSQIQAFLKHGQDTLNELASYVGDSIAVLDGACLGGGLEFAMACKHRLVVDKSETRIGMPEASIGLMPGWGGTQRLIKLVGIDQGMRMLLDSSVLDARQAFELGLADAICDLDSVEEVLRGLTVGAIDGTRSRLRCKNEPASLDVQSEWKRWLSNHTMSYSPSQQAILKAVEVGIGRSLESSLRAERELFFALLSEPKTRQNLHKFATPKS
jgi:3-hydroxyacyl-CoA dehydrogenase/enoyl-CoA hydratase/3-hydroxybutyryl-CoA epimerase